MFVLHLQATDIECLRFNWFSNSDAVGASAQIDTSQKNAHRPGPTGWPLQGIAALCTPMDCQMIFDIYPVADLLAQGIRRGLYSIGPGM